MHQRSFGGIRPLTLCVMARGSAGALMPSRAFSCGLALLPPPTGAIKRISFGRAPTTNRFALLAGQSTITQLHLFPSSSLLSFRCNNKAFSSTPSEEEEEREQGGADLSAEERKKQEQQRKLERKQASKEREQKKKEIRLLQQQRNQKLEEAKEEKRRLQQEKKKKLEQQKQSKSGNEGELLLSRRRKRGIRKHSN